MNKKKIALVGFRLNKGGAERVMAILSNYLDLNNFIVHIIIFHNDISYPCAGTIYNLGKLKSKSNTIFNKINRFIALKNYFKKNNFDFVIDFRFRKNLIQEFMISKFIYPKAKIYTVHSSKIDIYIPKNKHFAKLIYNDSYKIISITKVMEQMIINNYDFNNVTTIYNPINSSAIKAKAKENIDLNFNYIISIGHYNSKQKQFDKLIKCYADSILPKKNIHLVILGDGKYKNDLLKVAQKNSVTTKVHLLGFKKNPFKYLSKAKFYVMTSMHEGMPMVLLESLVCSTPVITFNCPTGPKEIIIDKQNGLLIENQNSNKLIEAMNLFVEDKELYNSCKKQAVKTVNRFSIDIIGKQWLNLLNNAN